MDDFWYQRWRENRIPFHEGKPNSFLAANVSRLGTRRRVLVPLCGKAEDLAFLAARGHAVVGVELVEDAVRAFFDEHQLAPAISRLDELAVYTAGPITMIAGDFFAVGPELAGTIDALYDRAAMVALADDVRPRYVAHVKSLAAPGSPAIVIAYEYAKHEMTGPPFCVPADELRAYYRDLEFLGEEPDPRREFPAMERAWSAIVK